MTLIRSRTRRRRAGCTGAGLTSIGARASIAVAAGGAIGLRRIRAHAGHRVARTHVMALVAGRARFGCTRRTRTGLTCVAERTCIAIVTCRAVSFRNVRAAEAWTTRASNMALIAGRTRDRIAARTHTRLTRIGLCADIVVTARRSIRERRIGADTAGGITHTGSVTLIGWSADNGITRRACAGLAVITRRTAITIAARCEVRGVRIRAHTGGRITRTRDVALVESRTHDRVAARTYTGLTCVGLRTQIGVVTCEPVRGRGIRTHSGGRSTRTRYVTLVGRRTDDRTGARTDTRLTRVHLRTRIAVITSESVRGIGIRADSSGRIACTSNMALIRR